MKTIQIVKSVEPLNREPLGTVIVKTVEPLNRGPRFNDSTIQRFNGFCLLVLLLAVCPLARAQTPTPVTLPVTLSVTFPAPLQTNFFVTNLYVTNVINNVTNYFVTVTNNYLTIITNVVSARPVVDMTNNVIAWPGAGRDLYREITIPTAFTLGAIPAGSVFVLQIRNLAGFPITWPAGLQVIGALPTNEVRSAVVFAEVHGEVWVSR
jgi:hypothetical protein